MKYLFDNVNAPQDERIIEIHDYSTEAKYHMECEHNAGYWTLDDMVICSVCGAVVANTETGTDSKTIYIQVGNIPEGETMQNIDTKSVITLIVAIAVSISFMFVVIAPAFNVIVPQTTSAMVFAMFGALAGFGGSQYGEAQAAKRVMMMQSK